MSAAGNRTLYFNREGETEDADKILYSKFMNGKYTEPAKIGKPVNSPYPEIAPFIAPDESYIIFTSAGRADGKGELDIYITFHKKNGSWTKPKNMGDKVNTKFSEKFASVSYDGKYLFFVSSRERVLPPDYNSDNYSPEESEKMKKFYNSTKIKPYYCDIYWIETKIFDDLKPEELKK